MGISVEIHEVAPSFATSRLNWNIALIKERIGDDGRSSFSGVFNYLIQKISRPFTT